MPSQFGLWKINFNVSFPPPYLREVWDYKNAKTENIQRSVSGIDWDFILQGKHCQLKIKRTLQFSKTILLES